MIKTTFKGGAAIKRAIVVNEHQMISEGLRELLVKTKMFDAIANYVSVDDAYTELHSNSYNFLFTDIIIKGTDVKSFIKDTRKKWPELVIVVITSLSDIYTAREAFSAGVNSYISKYVGGSELELAITKNLLGEKYISSDLVTKFAISSAGGTSDGSLTKREMEIMGFVAKGYSIAETASQMHLSQHTIITHRRNIMHKLKVNSAVGVTRYALANNHLLS